MARTPGEAADRVAAEVQQRIERLATLAADAILHSLYAPQVVSPPREAALDYWETLFFTPDGYVNQPGRDQVFKQLGGAEYKKIALDLAARMRKEGREAAEEAPAPEEPLEPVTPATAPAELAAPPLYGPRTAPAA
jgi:hypothetical protein